MQDSHHNVISDEKIVLYGHYRTIFSVIFAIIAGVSLVAFLFLYTMKTTVANPEFYKSTLKKADVYNRLINEGIPSVIANTTISQDVLTNLVAQKTIIYIVKQAVPADWVEQQVDTIIDKISEVFSNPHSTPDTVIKLESMSTYLSQISDGVLLLEQVIPSCAQSQNMNAQTNQLLGVSIDCKSMNVNLDQIKESLKTASAKINQLKTVSVDIGQEIQNGVEGINAIQQRIQNLKNYIWITFIIFLLAVLFLAWMQFKKPLSLAKYLAWIIFSTSILALITAFIQETSILNNINGNLSFNLPAEMSSIITDFAKTAVIAFFYQIKLVSAILFGVSLVTLIITTIIGKREDR